MRRIIVADGALLLLAPSAQAAELHLKRLTSASTRPVASGAVGELVYVGSAGVLTVRKTGKPIRTYPLPAGCLPEAVASGFVALGCQAGVPSVRSPAILAEADGTIVPIAAPSGVTYDGARALGTRWLLANTSFSPDTVHTRRSQALVQWRTGRTIRLGSTDPFGKRKYPNLNTADPGQPLCVPLTRTSGNLGDLFNEVRFATVELVGRWVLQTGSRWQLQRCGSDKIKRFAPGSRPVLGPQAISYLRGRRIVYQDLRSNHKWVARWPTTRRPVLAMFGRRLVVSTPSTDGRYTIYQGSLRSPG